MCISPRFAVMMAAMALSIIFTIIDICAVTGHLKSVLPIGINPFWKLAFIFKLLTDTVILDDFKTVLDKLSSRNMSRMEKQFANQWADPKAGMMHREVMVEPCMPARVAVAGGRNLKVSREPWNDEMKVESFHIEYAEDNK